MKLPKSKSKKSEEDMLHPLVKISNEIMNSDRNQASKKMLMRNLLTNQQKRAGAIFAKYKFSPLETLVAVATDPETEINVVHSIAAMLLPYEVPKLKSVDLNVSATEAAPRIAIKNFTLNIENGQPSTLIEGEITDVTEAHAYGNLDKTSATAPLVEAVNRAADKMIRDQMVEASSDEDDGEDE